MKISTICLKYDYGIKERGESNESRNMVMALRRNLSNIHSLWIEDHGFPNDIPGLQEKIKKFIDRERPSHVFMVLMKEEVSRETMDWMRAKGIIVVNWFCDCQWRLPWGLDIGKHMSGVITMDKFAIPEYKKAGIPVIHSQWASDWYRGVVSTPKYRHEVSFVGSKNSVREWYVEMLKEAGIEVACFGSGWERGRQEIFEMREVVYRSKINLNLSNSNTFDIRYLQKTGGQFEGHKFAEQIKARHFEIPAYGGFQLSHYSPEIEDYFDIGKEIAIYSTPEDLVKQVRWFLSHDEIREDMKHRGYRRAREYDYDVVMRRLIIDMEREFR